MKRITTMKTIILLLCICGSASFYPVALQAQSDIDVKNRYLLDQFIDAVAVGKGGGVRASFNYDCVKQEMQFVEDDEILKLDPISSVDTMYLGKHKMVRYANRFVELAYASPQYNLFIDYKRRIINEGKKGAMGTKTQGGVENIDIRRSAVGLQGTKMADINVYNCKDESRYMFEQNKKMKQFNNLDSFLKIFPEKKEQIKAYVKDHNISFKKTPDVISLIEFSLK